VRYFRSVILYGMRGGAQNATVAFPSTSSGQAAALRQAVPAPRQVREPLDEGQEPRYFILFLFLIFALAERKIEKQHNRKVPCCRRLCLLYQL